MAVRRLPLAEFAPREPATAAFAEIWTELRTRLDQEGVSKAHPERRLLSLHVLESLIAHLELVERESPNAPAFGPAIRRARAPAHLRRDRGAGSATAETDVCLVHRFDTERRDLERSGHLLELRERNGSFFVVFMPKGDRLTDPPAQPQVQIDNAWAVQILAEQMSPLAALEQRLGRPGPRAVEELGRIAGRRKLRRMDTCVGQPVGIADRPTDPSGIVSHAESPQRV